MIVDPTSINSFWEEIQETIEQLLSSRSDDRFEAEPLLTKYRDLLQKVDTNLTFHFQSDEDEDGRVEMVFGCDGFPESIHAVLTLIGAAPELQGIEFKAFNERYDPVPLSVNIGDEFSRLDDFWYRLSVVERKLHLEIYLEDAPKMLETDARIEAVMIFLDALIGEYELMTKVSQLDWFELPKAPEDFGLGKLADFREDFDRVKLQANPIGMTLH